MKKPLLSLFLGCLLAGVAHGQSRVSVSVLTGPFYSHLQAEWRIVLPDPATGQATATNLSSRSTGVGYTVGVLGQYAFSPRWSVATGFWLSQLNLSRPTITTTPATTVEAYPSRMNRYELPLLVSYEGRGRLVPVLSAGGTLLFPTATTLEGFGRVRFDQRVRFVPTVSAGAAARLNDRISLLVQPVLQVDIPNSSLVRYTAYTSYRLGLQGQLRYRL